MRATTVNRRAIPATITPAPTLIRRRSQRLPSRPESTEATSTPSGKGKVVSPDCSGDRPKPVCRKTASTRKNPATPEKKIIAIIAPSM